MSEIIDPGYAGIPASALVRNGLAANAAVARAIGRLLNHISGYHGTVLPGMEVLPANALAAGVSAARLWTQYYRATPSHPTLVSEVHLLPTDDATAEPCWLLEIDGVAQTTQYHRSFCASGAGTDPGDIFVRRQEVTVTRDALHRVDLLTQGKCRVAGWHLYEKERASLGYDTSDDVADYRSIVVNSGVLDSQIGDLIACADSLWQKARGCHLCWNVDDPASPIAATSTATNVWDGSTGWTSGTVGVTVPTQYRNPLMGTSVRVLYWALAERTGGAGEVGVQFAQGSGGSYSSVAVDGALGIYSAVGYLASAANAKVDLRLYAPAGTTGNLYAAGFFPLFM